DIKQGSVIAKKGSIINPRIIGAVASQGTKEIKVKKKPFIAYFSTGNEIIKSGENLENGKVYDINSKTIIAAIKQNNCDVLDLGIVEDNLELIKKAIEKGLEADFVLLSGGSSLGGEDFMVEAVNELGDVVIHGIAVKPGKPVLVGKIKDKLILGLPGYPTSALSNFYILVVPIIQKMIGISPEIKTLEAKLSRKIVSTVGRYEFMAVKLENNEAIPVMKGSSSITTLAEADGFIEIDENTEVLEKGSIVTIRLF
ncbi:MAG: molybdenum cofactor synthesis domain-containing protein, partial [Candidatus Woesearchaeota archaeon]